MLHIIEKLAYQIVEDNIQGQAIQILTIHNSDGSPRWICPAKAKKPYFLKFYHTGSSKARLIALLFKIIFFLRLQKLFFKTQTIYIAPAKDIQKTPLIDIFQENWAIFTGTIGPNRKALVYQDNGKSNYFFKVAFNERSQALIQKEFSNLRKVQSLALENIKVPLSKLAYKEVLQVEDLSHFGERNTDITCTHIRALDEIYTKTKKQTSSKQFLEIHQIEERLTKLNRSKEERLPKGLLKKLNMLYKNIHIPTLEIALAHGDFTAWNMYMSDDKLYIYDWELAKENMPLGFDAFHFIIQQGILVERKCWKEIYQKIKNKLEPAFPLWSENDNIYLKNYLKMYLLVNITQYLEIYSQQEKWHTQVHWLLQTWNDAVSNILGNQQEQRKLLILDTFDFLANINYACINFPNETPENLLPNSDIDICIRKKDFKKVLQYLENHSLTLYTLKEQKSFMCSVKVFLKDNSILTFDFIWKIRRKSLVLLNINQVLANSEKNVFGIKQMSAYDLAKYIGLFYALNRAKIPEKYKHHLSILKKSNLFLDYLLLENAGLDLIQRKQVRRFLKKEKANFFPFRFLNLWRYWRDKLKQISINKGFIVTFSGVDGAGKSTVIENVRFHLEKKLRKSVVVLRHRPSILPILSRWTKGKTKAMQEASEGLPHRGKNKSTIGSLLRFAYYYTDYLLGQFYVYFKYLSRGYVVLYDRYYFDFMVDAKRSNIKISPKISKFGYRFLLKPKLNFFLYADAETILQRKQELNKETVKELTENYLSLFEDLDKKRKLRYFPIKNITLEHTKNRILQTCMLKMI